MTRAAGRYAFSNVVQAGEKIKVTAPDNSSVRRMPRVVVSAILAISAVFVAMYAYLHFSVVRNFRNPIAYTMDDDAVYVVEKEKNTILQLEYVSAQAPMELKGSFRIERDDAEYYYMVRKLYRGSGLVVQSYIYRRDTEGFVGYRFLEYPSFNLKETPRRILTVFFQDPTSYPEINYAGGGKDWHYFVNSCDGQRNIWKVPAAGNVMMTGGRIPPDIQELGDTNGVFSSWSAICVDPEGDIFIASGAADQVVEYSPDGRRIREIGTAGFNKGELLAPDGLSFSSLARAAPSFLTVASTGNRSWVQFSREGQPIQTVFPLTAGYPFPDILVGPVDTHKSSGEVLSFDLVNKSLVVLSRDFASITTYRTKQMGKTCLLSCAALALLLLAFFWIRATAFPMKLRFPFFIKLLVLFVPLLAISSLVVGDWAKDIMKADLEAESIRRSANLARAVMNTVSLADLESIRLPEDRESEAYERIFAAVGRIIDTRNADHMPKWIIHKIRDGRFYFGINIWRGPIYEPFIVPRERGMFFKALEDKACQSGRFTDDQGEWFSYLCPILNADGEVIYVIELYRPTEELDRSDRKASRHVARIVGATALAAALLAFLFSYIFTRPLRKLMEATRIVSTGNFDQKIEVNSHDEMRDLAGAFSQMVVDLKKYINDLARTTAEKERIQSELRFARELQQGILPKVFPPFPQANNIEIFARMEPAREVGGDYYDFFLVDKDHMGVVIADVSGKGVSAGLFMMVVRTLLRNNAMNNLSAADAIARTNRLVASDNPSSMFATVFYLVCDMRTGNVKFCNAGHNPPIRLRENNNQVHIVEQGQIKGVLLGVMDEAQYSDSELTLAKGESLVLYTDGVTEPVNKKGEMYGEERLIKMIETNAHLPNLEICRGIYEDVAKHQEGLEQFDDITLLFFKFLGAA